MRLPSNIAALAMTLLIAACTTMPTGPGVMVLPGTGKSFDQFRADDVACRNYALASVGGVTASQAASGSGVASAVVGTVLGAAAGAAIDGHEGAAVGAGTGLLIGGFAGTGTAQASGYDLQYRYDTGYVHVMHVRERSPGTRLQPWLSAITAWHVLPPARSEYPAAACGRTASAAAGYPCAATFAHDMIIPRCCSTLVL